MNTRETLLESLRALAAERPIEKIKPADIARHAGVSTATVQRYLGVKENFPALVQQDVKYDTRTRILESAAKIFAQKGYTAASLDEVATHAGLTKGAIYWHFKSKSDLFYALLDHRFKRDTENIPEQLASIEFSSNPRQGLVKILHHLLQNLEQEPEWPLLYIEFMGQARSPEILARIKSLYQESYQFSVNAIELQKQLNLYDKAMDSKAIGIFWSALLEGVTLSWLINRGELDFYALTEKMVDLLWNGIAPKETGESSK